MIKNKKLAISGIVIIILGIVGPLFQGEWQSALLFLAVGALLLWMSRKSPKQKNKKNVEVFSFPEMDDTGHRKLANVTYALTGITHEHFGSAPQNSIPHTNEGDQVLLHADLDNLHDKHAVWVSDTSGKFLGWIPSESNEELFDRINRGETLFARVKKKYYVGVPDETEASVEELMDTSIGCIVEIARYSKAVVTK